jgi:glycosyltransferase involved in cell wall biosynthesis
MMNRVLSIGIIGTRGIPNRYGGFEACAEQIGKRLVKMGHEVTVYCGKDHPVKDKQWEGIKRILTTNPEVKLGSFGQFLYDLYCNMDSRKRGFDAILHLGYTSDSIWYRLWSKRSRHLVNMDGLEWQRQKYHPWVRMFLRKAEKMAVKRADCLIADNPAIETYLRKKYNSDIRMIPYGAEIPDGISQSLIPSGLEEGGYDLIVARMEPENNIQTAIEAKISSKNKLPLLIIGNENKYSKYLQKKYHNQDHILFHEAVYDAQKLNSIRRFARYYIHGHSAGGTNPSLLEAMACECNIIANDNPFNRAVLGKRAMFFSGASDLDQYFRKQTPVAFSEWRKENLQRIKKVYNWDIVSKSYEQVLCYEK